jgi:acyl-CoA thioesterase I
MRLLRYPCMMSRRLSAIFVGIAFALVTVAGCGRSAPKIAKLDADAVILAFGDSLTFGTGAAANESYPAVLQGLIGRKVIAAGEPGEVSQEGLARLPALLDEVQPKLLILCHGGNDFLRKLDDAKVAANVRAMIKLARDRSVAVVLIATPKPGLFPSTPEFYLDIAREFAIPYDDSVLKKVLTDNALKSDLVHPNARGYARIAETVADLLRKAGAV